MAGLLQRIGAGLLGGRYCPPPVRLDAVCYCGCGSEHIGTDAELAPELDRLEDSGEWVAEPKIDGVWVQVDSRGARSRSGRPVAVHALPRAGVTLVGEYVARSGIVWVHDLLTWGRGDYRRCTRTERRRTLDRVFCTLPTDWQYGFRLMPQYSEGFADELAAQAEGLVLKRVDDGAYRAGRNPGWVKVKRSRTYDAIVTAYVPGPSGRAGALQLAQFGPDGQLLDCGKVAVRGAVAADALAGLWTGAVVELSAYCQYRSGAFRSPVLLGRRDDKSPEECVRL